MAAPTFTSVLEDQPDRIVFQRRDGGRFTSPRSPAAEKLAAGLPRAEQPQFDPSKVDEVVETSPRVAQVSGLGTAVEVLRASKRGLPEAGSAAPPSAPTAAATSGLQVAPEVRKQQADEAAKQTAIAQAQQRAEWLASPEGRKATADQEALAPVSVPGSPGVTQQQLQQKATQGTLVPTRGGMRVEGAKPVPDEYVQAREAAFQEQERIANEERAAAERTRMAQAAEQERRATEIGDDMRAHELAKQRIQQARQQREAQLAAADRELDNWQENPLRIYGERGTFSAGIAQVASVIAQAAGAYAAILGGGPNFAMEIVNNAIDRDVQAQRAEYQKNKERSNNLYARLNLLLGDEEAALEKTKDLEKAALVNYGDQLALSTKRDDVMLAWQKARAQIQEQRLATHLALIDRAQGNVTITGEGAMRYPQAPSAGYTRNPTPKEIEARYAHIQKREDLRAGIAGQPTSETRQKMLVDESKAKAEGAGGASPSVKLAYAKERDKVTVAQTALSELSSVLKKYTDEDKDIPGHGITAPLWWASAEGRKIRSAREKVLAVYVKAISGAAATDNERQALRLALFGYDDVTLRNGMDFIENDLRTRGEGLDAIMQGTGAPEAYANNIAEARRRWAQSGNAGLGPEATNLLIQRVQSGASGLKRESEIQLEDEE